jgi:chlorite dismutase
VSHDNTSPEGTSGGFALFAVLGRQPRPGKNLEAGGVELDDLRDAVERLAGTSVALRGIYDVSGMRATAELLLWLHGDDPAGLQRALRAIRRTTSLAPMDCQWSAMGVHREAEFNKRHVPGFLRGEEPREWLCVYPFVRSYEWYLLHQDERAKLLAEHGRKGALFTDVVANTVSTFGLSDYEWLLPLESDNLLSLVDMMRELRATGARRHVREEVPFFTGRRVTIDELAEVLS